MKERPKVMTDCPYCRSPQEYDKLHTRFYECGTTADRDNGNYTRKCRGIG